MLHLHQNMRLEQAPENAPFANWLLDVGAGKGLDDVGNVTLPAHMHCGNTVKDLINATYPDIGVGNKDDQYFLDRTILSCKNDSVHDLNNEILSMFPVPSRLYTSADSVVLEDGAQDGFQPLPVEFLNSITTSGLPLAHLKLKEGCPLMLLRNLDPSIGLCNGTRMRLIRMKCHVLECHILGGRFKGNKVFIHQQNQGSVGLYELCGMRDLHLYRSVQIPQIDPGFADAVMAARTR